MKIKFVALTLFTTLLLILLSDPSAIIADGPDDMQDAPTFTAWTGLAPEKTPDGTLGRLQSAESTSPTQLAPNGTTTFPLAPNDTTTWTLDNFMRLTA